MIPSLYKKFQNWAEGGSVWLVSDTHFDDIDRDVMGYTVSENQQITIMKKKIFRLDTMIHLGDVGNPEYLNHLNCYKVLVLGNHDWTATKYKPYFDEIYTGPLFIGEKILLSHEPIDLGNIAFNFHGHDHNPKNIGDSHHMNLAGNVVQYEPANLGKLIKGGILADTIGIHRACVDHAIEKGLL